MAIQRRRRQPRQSGTSNLAAFLDRTMQMILPMVMGQQQRGFQAEQAELGRRHQRDMATAAQEGREMLALQEVIQGLGADPTTGPADVRRAHDAAVATFGVGDVTERMRTMSDSFMQSPEERMQAAQAHIAGMSGPGVFADEGLPQRVADMFHLGDVTATSAPPDDDWGGGGPPVTRFTEVGQDIYRAIRGTAEQAEHARNEEAKVAARAKYFADEAARASEENTRLTDLQMRMLEAKAGDQLRVTMDAFNQEGAINRQSMAILADNAQLWTRQANALTLAGINSEARRRLADTAWARDTATRQQRLLEAGEWQTYDGSNGGLRVPTKLFMANGDVVELPLGWLGSIQYNKAGDPMAVLSIGALSKAIEGDAINAQRTVLERANTPILPDGTEGKPRMKWGDGYIDVSDLTDAQVAEYFKPRTLTTKETEGLFFDLGAAAEANKETPADSSALARNNAQPVDSLATRALNGSPEVRAWSAKLAEKGIPALPPPDITTSPQWEELVKLTQAATARAQAFPNDPRLTGRRDEQAALLEGLQGKNQQLIEAVVGRTPIEELLPWGPRPPLPFRGGR